MAFLVKGAINMATYPFRSAPSVESEPSSLVSSTYTSASPSPTSSVEPSPTSSVESSPNTSGAVTPTSPKLGQGSVVGLEKLSAAEVLSAVTEKRSLMDSPRGSVASLSSMDSVRSHSKPGKIVTTLQVDTNSAAYKKAEAMLTEKSTVMGEVGKFIKTDKFSSETKLGKTGHFFAIALKVVIVALSSILTVGIAPGLYFANQRDTTNEHIDRLNNGSFTLSDRLQREGLDSSQKDIEGMRILASTAPYTQDTFTTILGDFHPDHLDGQEHALQSAKQNMDMSDIRAEMKPQLKQWLDSITALGKGCSDEQYRALISIATQKVADKGLQDAEKTWLTQNAAAFYGTSAAGRIAADLGQEVRAPGFLTNPVTVGSQTMTGIESIHAKIDARAQLIADVTGRDVDEVTEEIYASLNKDASFTSAMKNYESKAYDAINKARDPDGLRASFLQERMGTLKALSMFHSHLEEGQKGSGEAYLKGILNLGGVQGVREHMQRSMFINGDQGKGEQAIQNAEEIHAQFQEMFDFLDNLEENFAKYVQDHELEAQKQLALLVDLQTLKTDSDHPNAATLDARLQKSDDDTDPKITQPINVSTEKANPISDADLKEIFKILVGEGTKENPGAPTMLNRFLDTLYNRKKLTPITGLTVQESHDILEADASTKLPLKLAHKRPVPMLQFTDAIQQVRQDLGLAAAQAAATEQAATVSTGDGSDAVVV